MRWMRLALILALVPLLAAPGIPRRRVAAAGGGSLTIVQTCTNSQAGGTNTDIISCAFGSNVTSGNVVVCGVANGESSVESALAKSAGTSTIGTVTERCDGTGANRCSVELHSAAVTGTGSLTMATNWTGPTNVATSIVCAELSNFTAVAGFAADEDGDDPQAETITATAGAYVYGLQCDWNAIDAARNYVDSPAHTEILHHRDATWYSVAYFRTTNTVAGGSTSIGMDGGWTPNAAMSQCIAEVQP